MLPSPLRRILPLLAAAALVPTASLALAAPGSAATPAAAGAPKACATKAPGTVTFTRARGRAYGWLRWTKPRAARGKIRYRVTIDGKRRKATTARRLKVRVRPGQKLRLKVATTRAPRCGRALRTTATFYAPTTPANMAAATLSETSARLSWARSRNGDGKLAAMTASTSTSRPAPPPTAPR